MSASGWQNSVPSDDDPILAEWIDEAEGNLESGKPVDLESYDRRDAGHSIDLRGLLPAIQMMAELGQSARGAASAGRRTGCRLEVSRRFPADFGSSAGALGIVYEAEQVSLGPAGGTERCCRSRPPSTLAEAAVPARSPGCRLPTTNI